MLTEKIGDDAEAECIKAVIKLWDDAGEGYLAPAYVTCKCCGKKSYLTLGERGINKGMWKGAKIDRAVLGVDLDPASRTEPPALEEHGVKSAMTVCSACWKQIKDRLQIAVKDLDIQTDVRAVFGESKYEKDPMIECWNCGNEQYLSEGTKCLNCGATEDKHHKRTEYWRLL